MNKIFNKIMIFFGLFFLDILYSSLITYIFKSIGFNIDGLSFGGQSIAKIIIDLSFMFILFFIYRKELISEFRRYTNDFWKNFSFGFRYWVLGLILMITSNLIISSFYPSIANNEAAVQNLLVKMPVYSAFSICIFAPFAEEIIFRKSLGKIFNNNFIFIIVSGLVFGLVHNLTGIGTNQMIYIIPYGVFGGIFAYMYVRSKSIFVPMTFHLIHNTMLVIISFMNAGVI